VCKVYVVYCIIFYCIELLYFTLLCIAYTLLLTIYCIVMYNYVLYCTVLYCTVLYYFVHNKPNNFIIYTAVLYRYRVCTIHFIAAGTFIKCIVCNLIIILYIISQTTLQSILPYCIGTEFVLYTS